MQKKAARRGQRALAFLLCLLMVVTLLPVMGASAAEGLQPSDKVEAVEGLNMSKQLSLGSDGTYTITLEAFATGKSQTVTQKSGAPLDIVLVIDQSGSMAYDDNGNSTSKKADRRMEKLKNAVKSFVNNISTNAEEYNVEHKIALVGYASDVNSGQSDDDDITGIGYNGSGSYWVNTGLYVNGSFKNYQSNVKTNYRGEVTSATDLTTQDYQDALVSVNDADGHVAASITTAINSFKASGATYTEYGLTMAQKVFDNNAPRTYTKEDGKPGQSQRIVVLFTDGKTNSDINTVLGKANTLKGDTYGAPIYCVGFGSSVDSDFLSHVSSNYSSASYGWISTGWYSGYYGYSGTSVDTKYSMLATNQTELNNIFQNISKDATESSTSTELTDAAVLKDIISENFDVTNAQASAASYTVTTTDGSNYSTGDIVQGYDATFDKAAKTVSVTGFNYKNNFVAPSHPGQKLVVTITGLIPNQSGNKLYSNDNEKSGIYESSSVTTPFAPFDQPYTTVDTENRVVDFGMTVNIGTNVLNTNAATKQYGTFALNNNTYTYNLKPVKDGNGNYTFGFTGVDSSLYFADGSWNKVNVIPANNVYFDDDLLNSSSDFTDSNQGYDSAVNSVKYGVDNLSANTTKTLTFTGTGIDVYCTTETDSGSVYAKLREVDAEGNVINSLVTDAAGNKVMDGSMNNTYVSNPSLINVPTLSFTGLTYGTYQLTIRTGNNENYKLDGVRIYNPANADAVAVGKESGIDVKAQFVNVREQLLSATPTGLTEGAVYVDEKHETNEISVYEKDGPKNEVYLAQNQKVGFKLTGVPEGATVLVGLSAPENRGSAAAKVTCGEATTTLAVNSAIDMYYPVEVSRDGYVVIENTSNSNVLLSVTNVQITGGNGPSSAMVMSSPELMSYMADFDALEIVDTTPAPEVPTPETPNNTISAIIHAIWAQVRDSIGKLFGRL